MISNFTSARDYDMRGEEYVASNVGVVSNVISTPQHTVVTNFHKWLNGIILKNEAVFTNIQVWPGGSLAAYIANAGIPHFFSSFEFFPSEVTHSLETDWQEHSELVRRICSPDLLKRDHWQPFVCPSFRNVIFIYRECHDLIRAVMV